MNGWGARYDTEEDRYSSVKLWFKSRGLRGASLLALCTLVAAGLALQATGAPKQPERSARTALAAGPLKQLAEIANHGSKRETNVLMGIAVDGPTAYTGMVKSVGSMGYGRPRGIDWKLSTRIVAQTIATGKRRTLFSRRSAVVAGLVARNGHAFALVYRVDSYRKKRVRVQLYEISDESSKPRLLSSERQRFEECYALRLTDVTADGQAVILRPQRRGVCTERGQVEFVSADKTRRTVVQRADVSGPAVSSGDWLLYRDGSRLRSSNLATGAVVDYWWGGYSNLALATDGDLLLTASNRAGIAGDFDDEDETEFPRFTAIPAADPAQIKVEPRLPRSRVAFAAHCGSGYVRLVAKAANYWDFYDSDSYEAFMKNFYFAYFMRAYASNGAFNAYVSGPVGVELRTTDGEFVRSLGVIDEGELLQPTCSGNTLTVPIAKSQTISYRQFDAS